MTASAMLKTAVGLAIAILSTCAIPAQAHNGAVSSPASEVALQLQEDPESMAFSWGSNSQGQLGDNPITSGNANEHSDTPKASDGGSLLDGTKISEVAAGGATSCAVSAGLAFCWGANDYGQLGDGTEEDSGIAVQVKGLLLHYVLDISVGERHACAVAAEGSLYCWGSNLDGQFGNGTTTGGNTAKLVLTPDDVGGSRISAVSAAEDTTCILAGAKAFCFGNNEYGQLGGGAGYPDEQYSSPVPVDVSGVMAGVTVSAIGAGLRHTCALAAGKAYCWGGNDKGQLGIGSFTDKSVTPVAVSTAGHLSGAVVKSLAVGANTSCVIAGPGSTRRAFCWGMNYDHELGNNSTADSNKPVEVLALGNGLLGKQVSSISLGNGVGCLVADGRGYCWGRNDSGQLGRGSAGASQPAGNVKPTGALSGKYVLDVAPAKFHATATAATVSVYSDVSAEHPFFDDISWLTGAGVARGYDDNTFRPGNPIDRQAMAAFLYRFENAGRPEPKCYGNVRKFSDVSASSPFCGAIEWLVETGLAPVAAKFHPGNILTRQVMAQWLFGVHHPGEKEPKCAGQSPFNDVKTTDANCGYIDWVAKAGVANGYPNGAYLASGPVNRDAMAAFFHRLHGLSGN